MYGDKSGCRLIMGCHPCDRRIDGIALELNRKEVKLPKAKRQRNTGSLFTPPRLCRDLVSVLREWTTLPGVNEHSQSASVRILFTYAAVGGRYRNLRRLRWQDYDRGTGKRLFRQFAKVGIYLTPPNATGCGLTRVANGTGSTCTACWAKR